MAWLWGKLALRRPIKGREAREEVVGYPRGSFEALYVQLQRRIEAAGGRVLIDCPATAIGREDGSFRVVAGAPDSFRRGHYQDVILPFTVLRRIDCVLAPTRTKVLETWVEGTKVFDRSNPQDRLYATGGYGASHDQGFPDLDDEEDR